jgi:high-affinity iron transporter
MRKQMMEPLVTSFGVHTIVTASGPSIPAQLLGSSLIGLREGLESAMVVMILVAFLVKSERRDALKWVWLGVAAAVAMTAGVFLAIQYSAYTIKDLAAEAIAGVASLLAVIIVSSMVLWMRRAAARLSGDLRTGMARALETGTVAVVALSFLAVGREGVETALFMVGYAEAETAWPLLGLIVGVLVASGIAYAMYIGAVHINLQKFFKYTGAFLVVVAAGILSYGLGALQTVGWLPGLGLRAFNIADWFDWSSWYGQIIQGVFNLTPTPTVLQLVAWLAYLVVMMTIVLRPPVVKRSVAAKSSTSTLSNTPISERSTS